MLKKKRKPYKRLLAVLMTAAMCLSMSLCSMASVSAAQTTKGEEHLLPTAVIHRIIPTSLIMQTIHHQTTATAVQAQMTTKQITIGRRIQQAMQILPQMKQS